MLFSIRGEWVEVGALMGPEQIIGLLDATVLPSLNMLADWEDSGRIKAGGVFPGERSGCWIMEAESAEELGSILSSLPFWGQMKWEVRALQTMKSCVQRELAGKEMLRNMVGAAV